MTTPGGIRHLYVHIPFCHRRCSYCDFNTYANMEHRIQAYVEALCTEIHRQGSGAWLPGGSPPAPALRTDGLHRGALQPTIFLGGGTPTMLSLAQLEQILQAADGAIPLSGAEVTVEANPGTVLGRDYLRGLRDIGVNRLSMGVQSLHDPTLRVLGRIHTAAEARASLADARAAGFDRVNVDLIFGLPGQTLDQWAWTLDQLAEWGADHLALYSLILEERTPLFAQVQSGRISVPDDDLSAAMYELAMERLADAGYVQYEISNWARDTRTGDTWPIAGLPAQACHHNLAYWLNADYLACGAGAHGHHYPWRWSNLLGIDDYIGAVRREQPPVHEQVALSVDDLAAETMMMGLRLNSGVAWTHFHERTGQALDEVYGPVLADLEGRGLISRDTHGVWLTPHGRMLGNQVFAAFL